jgi:signal transduction histidine kinase/CheY-like chemotaxis protein
MKLTDIQISHLQRFQTFAMKRMASSSVLEKDSLSYWRVRILFTILFSGLMIGVFVFIPVVALVAEHNLWALLFIDVAVWLICLGMLVLPGPSYEIRASITLLICYLIGLIIIIFMGILSGGPAWLFAFAVLVGVLLGSKAAIGALIFNAATLIIIGWLFQAGQLGQSFAFFKSTEAMVTAGANFMLLNTVAAMSVAVLVKGLLSAHQKENDLTDSLKREHSKLIELTNELELDIEERKQAEEALRKSEEKLTRSRKMESLGLLAGGVAHDLNNVLSGIVSYPELILLDLPEDSQLREPVETIRESGIRAAAIVQDLLTVARGAAITREPLNINDLVDNYLDSPEYKKLKQFHPTVRVKTNLSDDLFNIYGSPVHIRKVLMNLVSNAAEAVQGSGTISISTQNRYLDRPLKGYDDIHMGEYIVLAVTDDGSGISAGDLERIFEPFYTKKIMGRSGTGLGLAVVWNIVLDHKGYIDVQTDVNGTRFDLYLPITRDQLLGKKLSTPMEHIRGDGETILVVDDVDTQRSISSKMLHTLGYQAESVSSGEDAIDYLNKNAVDLVLLDMIMDPGINGRETFRRIKEIQPDQKAIIVSGFAETDDVKATQQLGAGQYIKKPISLERIGMAVKSELTRRP